mmetsp:Transcript_13636/g.27750  ORF Transcript_13636/g.27750 Transcript_13636/m.27750 type:complete len:709 (+) Transcript_13636:48-2174(+)
MAADIGGDQSFFGCPYCQEAYPDKHELEVHERMTHPGKEFAVEMRSLPERERQLLKKAPTAAISRAMPLSEVSRHCIPEDCWVAIEGKVYDLTEFADRHPGGPTTILKSAGKDATKMFKDIHKGVRIEQYLRPEAFLGDAGIDEDLMSDEFWHKLRQARIEEVEEELERLGASADAHPAYQGAGAMASTILDVLQAKGTSEELKARLRTLETQKRVALDAEDFPKASEIKAKQAELLSLARVELGLKQDTKGGIPLSEVARHNKPHDLWVALNGVVYDLTDFLLHHPEQRNVLLAWAGRDATPVWDKIPGRFPSKTWMSFYMRPELRMGDVGPEAPEDPNAKLIKELRVELRRLQGPSEEEIQAAKAGTAKPQAPAAEATSAGEEERFPKLKDVKISKELPFFTRAEVAKHKGPAGGPAGTEPYMILHNKVYDLRPLLGSHPGGDELLLSSAGMDATKDFELFEHSEKARVRREQDMLVGYIVPAESADWGAEAAAGGGAVAGVEGQAESEVMMYLRYKAMDIVLGLGAVYAYRSWKHRKPLSMLTYSRLLRHMHLIMAVGIFGTLASAKAASYAEGLTKKRLLQVHKQSGFAMFVALLVRIFARSQSGIPPRFPGLPAVQFIETQSLRLFYLIIFVLPVSGMAQEYFLKWAGGDDAANDRLAQQSIEVHKKVGKFFEFVWMPFHLGYTTLYHASQGRGVVRKVSPFI